jgi:hypothetical protein
MHPQGTRCLDNEPGQFSIGFFDKLRFATCDDKKEFCRDDDENIDCLTLTFICSKGKMSSTTYLIIALSCLGTLSIGLMVGYCLLKRKLQNTIRLN